jgi:GntR family transcriptional repressor for pyruvate dehydrogenase complex
MVTKSKLYQRLVDALTNEIISGGLKRGAQLPTVVELADKYDVSRSAVREALIALECLGLVEAHQGSGIYVTGTRMVPVPVSDTNAGAVDLLEARRLLEGEVVVLAAALVTDDDLVRLNQILAFEIKDYKQFEAAEREFHRKLADATRNDALLNLTKNMWVWICASPNIQNLFARATVNSLGDFRDHYVKILDGLQKRQPSTARKAVKDYLNAYIKAVLDEIERQAMADLKSKMSSRRHEILKRTNFS